MSANTVAYSCKLGHVIVNGAYAFHVYTGIVTQTLALNTDIFAKFEFSICKCASSLRHTHGYLHDLLEGISKKWRKIVIDSP
jgi:hypothetical protein